MSTASVIPLENGIQVKGMGMDPGFHRGDDREMAFGTEFNVAKVNGAKS